MQHTKTRGISLIKAVTGLLRECHTLNKAVAALSSSKAASLNKAVILLWHTTALLRDPYCIMNRSVRMVVNTQFHKFYGRSFAHVLVLYVLRPSFAQLINYNPTPVFPSLVFHLPFAIRTMAIFFGGIYSQQYFFLSFCHVSFFSLFQYETYI